MSDAVLRAAAEAFEKAEPFHVCWDASVFFAQKAVHDCRKAASTMDGWEMNSHAPAADDPTVIAVAGAYLITLSRLGLVGN